MDRYLQMFCWGNYHLIDNSYIRRYLHSTRPTMIEYISQEEWLFKSFVADALVEYASNNDVQLKILLNSYDMWGNKEIRPDLKNVIYEDCPTFIMNYVLESFISPDIDSYNQSTGNIPIQSFEPLKDFKFKIVSLTNKAFWWRSKMVDHFAEHGVINPNNCIVWHNVEVGDQYDYKFFKPEVLTGGDQFRNNNGGFNSFKLHKNYSKSWFAAVYETSIDIIAMSEKVFSPLLYLKPFIVLGSKGYHQFLKSLGFELYDEFIDYSFDLEDDTNIRIEKYCKEIAKINNFSENKIKFYNDAIRQKLIHNKKQVYKIFFDRSLCPNQVVQWKEIIPTGQEILKIDQNVQDNFYRAMLRRGWYTKTLLPL